MELAYAGLHQLCAPMLDHLERLPAPQRDALRDRVRPAAGRPRPTGSWWGSRRSRCWPRWPSSSRWCASSTTRSGSTARRRRSWGSSRAACWPSRIALVFAARSGIGDDVLLGAARADRRRPGRLRCARAAAGASFTARSTTAVRDQIVAETHGNPLALLELPRTWNVGRARRRVRAAGRASRSPGKIEQSYAARIAPAPRRQPGCCCSPRPPSRSATPYAAPPCRGDARPRHGRGPPGGGCRAARGRRARRVRPSARPLRRLPLRRRCRPPRRASRARRGDRSRAGPGPARVASRARDARARRGGRRRARALGRPRRRRAAGSPPRPPSWSARSSSPPTPRDGRPVRSPQRRRSSPREASMPPRRCSPSRTAALSTSCARRERSACAPRSRSTCGAAAMPRRSCCAPPSDSSHSTPSLPRDVSRGARGRALRRSRLRAAYDVVDVARAARAAPRGRDPASAKSFCSWGSPPASRTGTRPRRRR